MARVRYTADGGHYRVGGVGFDPGDERDVDDDLAEYLADLEDFEVVKGDGDGRDAEDETQEMGYEERTAHAEGLANEHWSAAVSTVEDGEADAFLDELDRVDDRDSVQDAIDERRDELED